MITLNILPQEKREEYTRRRIYQLIFHTIELILVFSIVAAILLLVARRSLKKSVDQLISTPITIEESIVAFEQRIDQLNATLRAVDDIQTQTPQWSLLLDDLAQRVPDGVQLNTIFVTADQAIEIRGQATTRNQLLALKNALTESPFLDALEFPLTNLLEEKNVSFEFRAIIVYE